MLLVGFHIIARQEDGLAGEGGFDGIERRFGLTFGAGQSGTFLRASAIGGEAVLAAGGCRFFCGMAAAQ